MVLEWHPRLPIGRRAVRQPVLSLVSAATTSVGVIRIAQSMREVLEAAQARAIAGQTPPGMLLACELW